MILILELHSFPWYSAVFWIQKIYILDFYPLLRLRYTEIWFYKAGILDESVRVCIRDPI